MNGRRESAGLRSRLAFAAVAAGLPLILAACGRPDDDSDRLARVLELYRGYAASFPEVPEATPDEVKLGLASGEIVLVDVRPPEERAVSTIPGAIDIETFTEGADGYRGKRIVCYCTIGQRSGVEARRLRAEGFDAANLQGGLLLWVHGGGAVTGSEGPTRRVHVYGARWDLLPQGYEGVW